MNKRQHKKKIKYIIDNIQTLNLKEDDILVFKVNIKKVGIREANMFLTYVKGSISNKLLLIPVGSDLSKKKGE